MRKGSLSLSVNAIVVLILAITMLGLGLGFMKGMFGKMTQKFDVAIGAGELTNPPTIDNPFTISTQQLTLSKGSSQSVIVAYFNNYQLDSTISVGIDCVLGDAAMEPSNIDISPLTIASPIDTTWGLVSSRNVPAGGVTGWQIGLNADNQATAGSSFSCSVIAKDVTSGRAATDLLPTKFVDFMVTLK